MNKDIPAISANNTLDFYHNPENIKNQDLIHSFEDWFAKDRGKNVFKLLDLFNLVWKQKAYVLENSNQPYEVIKTLTSLPLSEIQKHILYFSIIQWYGGVNNMNDKLRNTLRLIENEFKKYDGYTPEKEIYFKNCLLSEKLTFQKLREMKTEFDKLGTYLDKLKYWDNHFWDEKGFSHYNGPSIFFPEIDTKEERMKSENRISIYPANIEETVQYNHWLLSHIQTDRVTEGYYKFEKLKEKYIETIEKIKQNNPDGWKSIAIENTERNIKRIEAHRDQSEMDFFSKPHINLESHNPIKPNDTIPNCVAYGGYFLGHRSVITNDLVDWLTISPELFKHHAWHYAQGIADAKLWGFLKPQLDKLKNDNEIKNAAIQSSSQPVLSAPVFALFLHYLLRSKDESGGKGLKNIKILCQKYEYTKSPINIKNIINSVNKENNIDPITINNIKKVQPLLGEYPNALALVNNELYSLQAKE